VFIVLHHTDKFNLQDCLKMRFDEKELAKSIHFFATHAEIKIWKNYCSSFNGNTNLVTKLWCIVMMFAPLKISKSTGMRRGQRFGLQMYDKNSSTTQFFGILNSCDCNHKRDNSSTYQSSFRQFWTKMNYRLAWSLWVTQIWLQ
jgi:hypothetical protein